MEDVAIRIRPSRDSAPVGSSLELVCQVRGAPGARASWQRVGAALPAGAAARGELLRLTELTADAGGLYRCTVLTPTGAQYTEDYALAVQGGYTTAEPTLRPQQRTHHNRWRRAVILLCVWYPYAKLVR